MSHISSISAKPGQPMFSSLPALQAACDQMGLVLTKKNTYTWYNRSVGDYPLPPGVTEDQLGKNAEYVVSLGPQARAKHGNPRVAPYELGLVADPNNPGCFIPMYDFFAGGYGLNAVIGDPLFEDGDEKKVTMIAPLLKQRYDMWCEVLAARQAGDRIEVLTAKQAYESYPQFCPASNDEETFVTVAHTTGRA